ncbi:MAG TPA: hypothetical protein VFA66_07565 [Gaiellaceae bacterium]|nr:hypothetical protein [Gaiellaceae bacterium]
MPLFRRREPLHERLAREGGLSAEPPADPAVGWMETGIHGVHRAREWDSVVTVDVDGVEGDRARFVALPDDVLLVEEGGDVEALAAALDQVAAPPYRAEAVRRGDTQWAIGIRRIQVVDLPDDPGGEEVTLTARDGERTVLVDGQSSFGSIPALEQVGAARGESYVVQARRLEGSTWEVEVVPL